MVSEGLLLMVVGMGTVFTFLGLIVGLMQGSAMFFDSFGAHFPEREMVPSTDWAGGASTGNDQEIAVVLAAVEAHRLGRGGGGA